MRARSVPGVFAAAVILLVALAPSALAQSSPVLVDRLDAGDLSGDRGAPAVATFRLFNLDARDDVFVRAEVEAASGWATLVDAPRFEDEAGFFLGPRQNATVRASFEPEGAVTAHTFVVRFAFVDPDTGTVTRVSESVLVQSAVAPDVFGVFPNPLPAPLDTSYGTFLLEMAFWAAIGLGAMVLGDTIVRLLTTHASNRVTREILTKLRRPIFYFVFFLGLSRSFGILPRSFFTETLAKTFLAIGVAIFGLYVLYRILDSALLYYQEEISPRTQTTVDDVLVPLIRKVGIVVLYVVGIVTTLRNLGWDPTLVFAGAGIAGLVIAFAAQDTFSNLFSGVFLLLDRPFKEGDDIQLETGEVCRVERIGLRTTRLYHGRNHELIVLPNNQLATKRVTNLAGPDPRYWVSINVGAAYGSDPEKVKSALYAVARAHPKVVQAEGWKPLVLFLNFGESSLDFVLRTAVLDYRDRVLVASELRAAIKDKFEREGIEIPFPQRTLWLRTEKEQGPLRVDVNARAEP
jgi:MscS family membrane protein